MPIILYAVIAIPAAVVAVSMIITTSRTLREKKKSCTEVRQSRAQPVLISTYISLTLLLLYGHILLC